MTDTTKKMENLKLNEDEQKDQVNIQEGEDSDAECFGMDDDAYFDFKDTDDEDISPMENTEQDITENVPKNSSLFEMLEEVCPDHKFLHTPFTPVDGNVFNCAMHSERTMMQKDLPEGIHVKFYENRLDLCTACIEGPTGTPYEACLFFFDVQVSRNYPHDAPKVKYFSYCSDKLNPNLYTNGLVCLSLLGTWAGTPEEKWSAKKSSLLQLFVSIQGLILVPEPFYNEPAYHSQRRRMTKESEKYNESVLRLVLDTMTQQINKPPNCFREQLLEHYREKGFEIHNRLEKFLKTPSSAPFPLTMDNNKIAFEQSLKRFKDVVMKIEKDAKN